MQGKLSLQNMIPLKEHIPLNLMYSIGKKLQSTEDWNNIIDNIKGFVSDFVKHILKINLPVKHQWNIYKN